MTALLLFVLCYCSGSIVDAFSLTSAARVQHHRGAPLSISQNGVLECQTTAGQDEVALMRRLTEHVLKAPGETAGLQALDELGRLCQRRLPFDFDKQQQQKGETVVRYLPEVLSETKQVLDIVEAMIAKEWISTNPDSVDGLPSYHLNLISDGKPIVDNRDQDNGGFEGSLSALIELIEPVISNQLLPAVHEIFKDTTIQIGDVFLRRYGQESRQGLSAHYDVFSRVTAVIALDNVAAAGTNGLYTTETRAGGEEGFTTSNHAALRRFFPLGCGDGVLHTWDILHGVDVKPGLDRTSLVVWFTSPGDDGTRTATSGKIVPPWLARSPDLKTNDVTQFVLASALESSQGDVVDGIEKPRGRFSSDGAGEGLKQVEETDFDLFFNPQGLYLQSASKSNAFALTRLGSLCESCSLSDAEMEAATVLLNGLNQQHGLQFAHNRQSSVQMNLAKQFWLEGALRGSPLAQAALADELMLEASLQGSEENGYTVVLAASLFGLAAQQGHTDAVESLRRVVSFEMAQGRIRSEQDFARSPVVAIATCAVAGSDDG